MSNQIYWLDNETLPNWYEVGYSESRDGEYVALGTTTSTTYSHSTGDLDTWYKIRASYANGTSEWSLPFQAIAEPTTDMCIVWGKIRDLDLRYPSVNVTMAEAAVAQIPGVRLPVGVTDDPVTSEVDAHGYFQLRLYRNVPVRLQVPEIHYDEIVLVPSSSSVDFTTLTPIKYRK